MYIKYTRGRDIAVKIMLKLYFRMSPTGFVWREISLQEIQRGKKLSLHTRAKQFTTQITTPSLLPRPVRRGRSMRLVPANREVEFPEGIL